MENRLKEETIDISSRKAKHMDKIFLEWTNLTYEVLKKETKKKPDNKIQNSAQIAEERISLANIETKPSSSRFLLNNVTGYAKPKELLGIMGSSGCGKTTLLNVLSERQLPQNELHKITRDVLILFINLSRLKQTMYLSIIQILEKYVHTLCKMIS
jgi:ABC-type uncharacterized transport system fused permease/ATPase subunit